MKKTIALICALALVLLCCAGCGSRTTASAAATEAPEVTEEPAVTEEPTAEPTEEPAAEATAEPAAEAETADRTPVRLAVMTGPTGMGMVKLLSDADAGSSSNDYEVTVAAAADEITPRLLQGELDIAAVPVNLASVLYNKTQGGVQMAAVGVLGVLWICEYGSDTITSLQDLKGQTIYATGSGSMPEYFLRHVLASNGIEPDKDVTIEFKSEPAEVVAALSAAGEGICMLPQPYVTSAGMQLGEDFHAQLSIAEEWDALNNDTRCTTACVVVSTAFAAEHPEAVEAFLTEYAASTAWVNENPADAGTLCEQYGIVAKAAVAAKAIPDCSIVCLTGNEMVAAASGCLQVLYEANPASVGGAMPGEDFWYVIA